MLYNFYEYTFVCARVSVNAKVPAVHKYTLYNIQFTCVYLCKYTQFTQIVPG